MMSDAKLEYLAMGCACQQQLRSKVPFYLGYDVMKTEPSAEEYSLDIPTHNLTAIRKYSTGMIPRHCGEYSRRSAPCTQRYQ